MGVNPLLTNGRDTMNRTAEYILTLIFGAFLAFFTFGLPTGLLDNMKSGTDNFASNVAANYNAAPAAGQTEFAKAKSVVDIEPAAGDAASDPDKDAPAKNAAPSTADQPQ